MLPNISELFATLAAIDPRLPGAACALVVLAIFLGSYGVRKRWPAAWEWGADLLPFLRGDVGPVLRALRKLWQAVPSAVSGAALTSLAAGASVKAAVLGALLGLLPPVMHELGKWCPWIKYRGETELPDADWELNQTDPATPSSKPPRS